MTHPDADLDTQATTPATTNRRTFLAILAGAMGAVATWPVLAVAQASGSTAAKPGSPSSSPAAPPAPTGPFTLPPLGYPTSALEPTIDRETMELHHGKHHKAYVDKLNAAVKDHPDLQKKTVEQLLADLSALPEPVRDDIRNQGGGHANHSFFWNLMTPGGAKAPTGDLAKAIDETFGSLDGMKQKFQTAGEKRFGSGWAWLVVGKGGKLEIVSTPNQDSPLSQGLKPVIGNDVWEHAYYLKHRNRRGDYLKGWWAVVNWDKAAANYARS